MKKNYLVLILAGFILSCFAVSGFFLTDNFYTNSINAQTWINRSFSNNCWIVQTNGYIKMNGTHCGVGASTFLSSVNSVSASENATLRFKILATQLTTTANNYAWGFDNPTIPGFMVASDGAELYFTAEKGTPRLCGGIDIPFTVNTSYNVEINITRVYNASGALVATNYSGDVGGLKCSNYTLQNVAMQANFTDFSLNGSAYHEIHIDDVTFTDYNYSAQCPGKPDYPVYTRENFDYANAIDSCYWNPSPVTNIFPTSGALCYASENSQRFEFYLPGQGNFYGAKVFTEEFKLSLSSDAYLEKDLKYKLINTGGTRKAYVLDFFSIGNDTYIQYYSLENGTTQLNSLCANCWSTTQENDVRLVMYGEDAVGYTAFNSTSNTFQPVLPNTYSVKINDGVLYFNLPIYQESPDLSNIPEWIDLDSMGGSWCFDSYLLYTGLVPQEQQQQQNSSTPFLQLGERCTKNSECYTFYCNYLGQCDRKNFASACTNNYECLSGVCSNDVCTKPTLWQVIDKTKDDTAGDDTNTNNLLSLIISIAGASVVLFMVARAGAGAFAGAIAGGAVFFAGITFFAIVGWLSPFILVGIYIIMILVGVLVVMLSNRG